MLNKTFALTLTAVAAFGLAACGSASQPAATTNAPSSASAPGPASTTNAATPTASATTAASDDATTKAALAAVATAEAAVPGGVAVSIDDEDSDSAWEVDVQTADRRVEVTVSADGTTVVSREDEDHDAGDWATASAAKVGIADAIRAALAHTPGRFDDADLDDHTGSYAWEVEVHPQGSTSSTELLVDPATGTVSKH